MIKNFEINEKPEQEFELEFSSIAHGERLHSSELMEER
jgi:hypothetical protein